eukprot:Pompholyxophrys_punicea_v1_NODE_493_length_1798_cov_6.648800.p1 type:complete len:208 gc:universal NODE_493_length_1798_cov_6.648800:1631-1008(-)
MCCQTILTFSGCYPNPNLDPTKAQPLEMLLVTTRSGACCAVKLPTRFQEQPDLSTNLNQKERQSYVGRPVSDKPASPVLQAPSLQKMPTTDSSQNDPTSISQRKDLLERNHLLGHYGANVLYKSLKTQGYSWSHLRQDCVELVKSCTACQRYSSGRASYHPLTSLEADLPLDHLAMDLIGPMPTSTDGYYYILLVIDVFSRFIFLVP